MFLVLCGGRCSSLGVLFSFLVVDSLFVSCVTVFSWALGSMVLGGLLYLFIDSVGVFSALDGSVYFQ